METRDGKKENVFDASDIEDVRIIIRANGKNWAITPKKSCSKGMANKVRILALTLVMEFHDIVIPALEDIDTKKYEGKLKNDNNHE